MKVANAGNCCLSDLFPCDSFLTIRCARGGCSSLLGGLLCSVNCHSTKIWSAQEKLEKGFA